MSYAHRHLEETRAILGRLDVAAVEALAERLAGLKAAAGRVFFLGVGGGAANSSHAASDFRKLVGLECYAPSDSIAEFTARANDEGWDETFCGWLKVSRLSARDALFVLSVGGGDPERRVSTNLVTAIQYARAQGASVLGIVGRDGGYTARAADACIVIPTVNEATVTAHTEALQAVIWHLLVSHPRLKASMPRWESLGMPA